jgi:hypothetical protein
MGSPSCIFDFGDVAAAVEWVRILLYNIDGDDRDDRESKAMLEDSDEDDSRIPPRRDNALLLLLLLFDVLQAVAMDERDLVAMLLVVVVFAETRATHLIAREAPVDIILLLSY